MTGSADREQNSKDTAPMTALPSGIPHEEAVPVQASEEEAATVLPQQPEAPGEWEKTVEPLLARLRIAASFPGLTASWNSDGARAFAQILKGMAHRLDVVAPRQIAYLEVDISHLRDMIGKRDELIDLLKRGWESRGEQLLAANATIEELKCRIAALEPSDGGGETPNRDALPSSVQNSDPEQGGDDT